MCSFLDGNEYVLSAAYSVYSETIFLTSKSRLFFIRSVNNPTSFHELQVRRFIFPDTDFPLQLSSFSPNFFIFVLKHSNYMEIKRSYYKVDVGREYDRFPIVQVRFAVRYSSPTYDMDLFSFILVLLGLISGSWSFCYQMEEPSMLLVEY